ncbi:Lrp/AsnC family transcriptional regulator [Tessaracoccus sp.]|uniref:Lrp/AsnC family transcriptional regulator n=1 Tax=Tessaracoccus sp. TaxID=1971211 RepID=UPI002615C9CE|nr:Lrp/AsnC family transcriptional regulator [Tessaracoccus sp.]
MNSENMPSVRQLDVLDARILLALDDDPNSSILQVAQKLGISRNTVHARMQRLERDQVLEGFSYRVTPTSLGYPLVAFVALALSQRDGPEAAEELYAIPEVMEVHFTTGDADLLTRVVAKDTLDLHRITNRILEIDGIQRTNTMISVNPVMPYRSRPLLERLAEGG